MSFDELLHDARSASARAARARAEALPETIRACRAIEGALRHALAGGPLRGLKNLGVAGEAFAGARFDASPDAKVDHFRDGRERLYKAIDSDGVLCALRWVENNGFWTLQVEALQDDDIRIGDDESLLRTLEAILPRHVERSERRSETYTRAGAFAARIRAALEK